MAITKHMLVMLISILLCHNINAQKVAVKTQVQTTVNIECNNEGCFGSYYGKEFIDGSDVGHQFSNTMSAKVGHKLKELYAQDKYVKVDFENIYMSTNGMGSGVVTYELKIPFVTVVTKCYAYTSFDHVGGWNHEPSLSRRKKELSPLLMPGESLDISNLKTTNEGLQEYWIQWKNKTTQHNCNQN
ncbi:hypothetical protein QSV08_16470 [Maribacter sp. BPC-D8]|uniref:hypothetical protein n=1 Tax=Maribacter sp. BPC-D8 TaxID=3053613 RepID=UPI002B4A4E36|nr:hypothetical protein [Maribacter sp. BPC-D8]WRI28803.1 hypothetical protein QSV08_16470 [Maribacter sp. BPC-D8]